MKVEKINPSLYTFTLSLNEFEVSMGVSVGEDGILLVDTGWTMTAEDVLEKIKELDEGNVKLIIFTHQHGDHIGGRHVLGADATLIAHRKIRDDLAGRYFHLAPLPGQSQPTILVDDQATINFNGEEIRFIPAPGHTDSDMIVHFVNSNVVFMGDLLFSDSFPAVFTAYGGDVDTLVSTLADLIENLPEDIRLIAGHGRDYSLEELREYRQMIVDTSELIKEGHAAGKDTPAILEDGLLADWEKWSTDAISTEDWIGFVSDCITGQGPLSIAEPLTLTILEQGIEAALDQYHDLKENQPDAYNYGENEINLLGYNLLWREMFGDAIKILELMALEYPESANSYDSLGDAYEQSGDLDRAREFYQKSLSIDPDFAPSKEGLERVSSGDK